MLDVAPWSSDSYVAWRVLVPQDSVVAFDLAGNAGGSSFATLDLWFVDPVTFAFSALISPAWYREGGEAVTVQADPIGDAVDVRAPPMGPNGEMLLQVEFQPSSTREWLIVAIAAFDGDASGTFTLKGLDDVRIDATSAGAAFLATERDFRGAANVVAREEVEPARDLRVEAKAQSGLAFAETAASRMFAAYWGGSHLGEQTLAFDGPDGAHEGREWYYVAGGNPGDYTFRIDQNVDWSDNTPACRALVGQPCWRIPAWVAGADVSPP